MKKRQDWLNIIMAAVSYILVAALASGLTYFFCVGGNAGRSKLDQLETLISDYFVGEYDETLMHDAAADAMIAALGDRWSYYIPAADMAYHNESTENAYVGIGVVVSSEETDQGFLISKVEPDGAADQAGLKAGDRIVAVGNQNVVGLETEALRSLIRGEVGTTVEVTVQRDGAEVTQAVTRQQILVDVAQYRMLDGNVGYIKIVNFNERCASQTIAAIDELVSQGAVSLLFDVRFNPGGYKTELVKVLDYLLPEGDLFRSVNYSGIESVSTSDSNCLEMPMAVLINSESYSAAEFFAAALEEYDWAVTVGEHTCGKSYYQNLFTLSDGSAAGISIGKYYTPKGVSLSDVGGLAPQVAVDVDEGTFYAIYAGTLEPSEDPQIQAALNALKNA